MLGLCPWALALDLAKGPAMAKATLVNTTEAGAAQDRDALLNAGPYWMEEGSASVQSTGRESPGGVTTHVALY